MFTKGHDENAGVAALPRQGMGSEKKLCQHLRRHHHVRLLSRRFRGALRLDQGCLNRPAAPAHDAAGRSGIYIQAASATGGTPVTPTPASFVTVMAKLPTLVKFTVVVVVVGLDVQQIYILLHIAQDVGDVDDARRLLVRGQEGVLAGIRPEQTPIVLLSSFNLSVFGLYSQTLAR